MRGYKRADSVDDEIIDTNSSTLCTKLLAQHCNSHTDITMAGIGTSSCLSLIDSEVQDNELEISNTPDVSFFRRVTGKIRIGERNSFWGRSSPLEKLLLIGVGFLCCVVITLITVLTIQSNTKQQVHITPHSSQLCLTPSCVTIASAIINAMDRKVDPCTDFYQYSCGGWIKSNPIPDGKSTWSNLGKIVQQNQLVMKNVLENNKQATYLSTSEKKAIIYYNSCMDKNETIEQLGATPMQKFLKLIGGWNISGDFDLDEWDLQKTLQVIHNQYNRGGLFVWFVGDDETNSTQNVIKIYQNVLGMRSRDYYISKDYDKLLESYLTFMTKIGILLGGEEQSVRKQMKDVLDFEIELALIKTSDDERLYHNMTLKEFNAKTPFIDWVEYFNTAFKQIDRRIDENESIVVYSPQYFYNLTNLLKSHQSSERKVVLANYLGWTVVNSLISSLSKPFREASNVFNRDQSLIELQETEWSLSSSSWRYCGTDTDSVMGFALGAMFVRYVFDGQSKGTAQEMIDRIKDAFKSYLTHLDWMDDNTRELAKEKVDAITDMIGFPDFILDPTKLDLIYNGLEFNEFEYFNNKVEFNKFSLRQNMQKIDKEVDKNEWLMTPATVNAYYTPTKNQIVFPAGILQTPFYDVNYPKSVTFGAIGAVMGHELTHAFDDKGRKYDKNGNMHQWWNDVTIERFETRMKCFIDQYSRYKIGSNDDHINGKQTLGENIADNGGLTAAYHAYQSWLKSNPNELLLPGVNVTNLQLFFIAFSQTWCSTSTPEALELQIIRDPHSPTPFRVIGTLSNSLEFAKQFNCQPNSVMNPTKKCVVW